MDFDSLESTVAAYAAGTCNYRIYYGQRGHPQEYTVNFGQPGSTDYIPSHIALALAKTLDDTWVIWDRGSRLEIVSANSERPRDDSTILAALAEVCGSK